MDSTVKLKPSNPKPKKNRKKLRDNIHGITVPALRRIMQRAGVTRISKFTYEKLRDVIKVFLGKIIKDMVVFVEQGKRKTAQMVDLEAALSINKIYLLAGLNPNSKTKSLQSCNSKGKSGNVKKTIVPKKGESKKTHRYRPGIRTARAIRFQQKNSECLAIPIANFDRLTREISQTYKDGLRFSEGVIEFLQLATETYLIELCADAYMCTTFSNRDTLYSKDIDLVISLRKE